MAAGIWSYTSGEEKDIYFAPKNGRYVRLVALSEINGQVWTSGAELTVTQYSETVPIPPATSDISKSGWSLLYVDSEETVGEDGAATNFFDSNPNTIWHTQWLGGSPPHPHEVQIDLGATYSVNGFRYLPRQVGINGTIKEYEFYVSTDPDDWGIPVALGAWSYGSHEEQKVFFTPKHGRYIRLVAVSEINGTVWASGAELAVTQFLPGSLNIPKSGWSLLYVDSEETIGEDGAATNFFDDDQASLWHTEWYMQNPPHPHEIQIDLGDTYSIIGFAYLPRQTGSINGTIEDYEFYISSDGVNWGSSVASGEWRYAGREAKRVRFNPKIGRYIRLVALSEVNNRPWTSGAEIDLFAADEADTTPPHIEAPADVSAEQSSLAGASVNLGTPLVSDDRDPDPFITNDAPAAFPLGETVVTWTVIDAGGNAATAIQRVTVVDTTPPNLVAPADRYVEQDSAAGAEVDLGVFLVYDNCDAAPAVTNNAPSIFPLGETTVTWTAVDTSGNSAIDIQIITVEDTIAPNVEASLVLLSGGEDDDEGLYEVRFSALDICDIAPTISAVIQVCGRTIPVSNGQIVEIEFDDECEIEWDDGRLEIEAEKVVLEVTAEDFSGNVGKSEAVVSKAQGIPDQDGELKRIRLMSYNIGHGVGTDGYLDLQRIADVIKEVNPDLVALQEVDRDTYRSNGVDQAALLARLTEMHAAFSPAVEVDGGESGNAILSRFPFKILDNIALPGNEERAALIAEVDLSSKYGAASRILFIATQLDDESQADRIQSADAIESYLSGIPAQPSIIAGDMNALPDSATLDRFRQGWTVQDLGQKLPTWPADNPTDQLDYIMYRQADDWDMSAIFVPDESKASDHLPIVSVFELKTVGMTPPSSEELKPLDQSEWSLVYVDSEETVRLDGEAVNLFDGDADTFWHTELGSSASAHPPHEIQIDLGAAYTIAGFRYLPRQSPPKKAFDDDDEEDDDEEEEVSYKSGTIGGYEFYVNDETGDWGAPAVIGSFGSSYSSEEKEVTFAPKSGRYIRLVAVSEINHNPWISGAELNVLVKAPSPTQNLALNRPVAVSSVEVPSLAGERAVDGSDGTRWASGYTDPQYISVDLGQRYEIGRVILKWETAYGKEYKIQVSNDASVWTDVYHEISGDGGKDDIILDITHIYRYIRMFGIERATNWGYSLYEFEVYVPGGGPPSVPKTFGAIIPKPAHSREADGTFTLTANTDIYVRGRTDAEVAEIRKIGHYLAGRLSPSTGYNIQVISGSDPPAGSIYMTTLDGDPAWGDEGYELAITPESLTLVAYKPEGLFRGIQTIRQLLPPEIESGSVQPGPWTMQCGTIQDRPAYEWRGFMFDVCRHFFSIEKVKQYIDLIAYYKMNIFHWHLTEDQGWRPEIDSYPNLMEVGAWRGDPPYGGWYTKEEMAEVVAYAAERYIDVLPEIEMPGHSTAALASYNWLMCDPINYDLKVREVWGVSEHIYCAGKETTFTFLQKVLDEIVEIFPFRVIHLGGDEAPKARWDQCPHCQARRAALGLANSNELQDWFIHRIAWYLYNKHGRNVTGWSEGGVMQEEMPAGTQGQFWYYGKSVKQLAEDGFDVVNTHYLKFYLDLGHTLSTMYNYDITEGTDPAHLHHILGVETPIWTEYVPDEITLDDRVFPRLLAVAENGWTPNNLKDYDDFFDRLQVNLDRLENMGVQYGGLED